MQMAESVSAAIILLTSTIFPFALCSGNELAFFSAWSSLGPIRLTLRQLFLFCIFQKHHFPLKYPSEWVTRPMLCRVEAPDMSDHCGLFNRCWVTQLEGRGPQWNVTLASRWPGAMKYLLSPPLSCCSLARSRCERPQRVSFLNVTLNF